MRDMYNPATSSPAIEQRKPYPASEDEAKKFRDNLMSAIHAKGMHEKVMQVLQSAKQQPAEVIGQLAAKIVMITLMKLKKTTGRKPVLQLALHGMKYVIIELSSLARAAGIVNVDQQTMKQAAMIAGTAVEEALKGKQTDQPQQPMPTAGQAPGQPAPQMAGPQPDEQMGLLGGMQ